MLQIWDNVGTEWNPMSGTQLHVSHPLFFLPFASEEVLTSHEKLISPSTLSQWFSNFEVTQNYLENLIKYWFLVITPKFLIQMVWDLKCPRLKDLHFWITKWCWCCWNHILRTTTLDWGKKSSVKGQIVNRLSIAGHTVSVAATQFCCCFSKKVATCKQVGLCANKILEAFWMDALQLH